MKPSSRLFSLPCVALLLVAAGPHGNRDRDREGDRGMPLPGMTSPPELRMGDRHGRSGLRRPDQDEAYAATREGAVLPLRQIEGRIVPRMPGASYLGPEFDSGSGTYRLKFMSRGAVSWIDVDGRTGAIIGRSGE